MVGDFLPSEDLEFLESNYSGKYEILDIGTRGLIIAGYRLPAGYQLKETKLMLLIPPNYPTAALDMFYFNPPILRADNREIAGLAPETHFGVSWQRWSRHYTNEWRAGIDSIATHITFVGNQLKFDLGLP